MQLGPPVRKGVRTLACPICKNLLNQPSAVPNGTACYGGHCYIDNEKREWSCVQCGQRFMINGSWTAVAGRHFNPMGICIKLQKRLNSQGSNQQSPQGRAPVKAEAATTQQASNLSVAVARPQPSVAARPIAEMAATAVHSAPIPGVGTWPSLYPECSRCHQTMATLYCSN